MSGTNSTTSVIVAGARTPMGRLLGSTGSPSPEPTSAASRSRPPSTVRVSVATRCST
ncbi:hypothetical protein ACRAWF_43025 [Streptomyces sp. L7]